MHVLRVVVLAAALCSPASRVLASGAIPLTATDLVDASPWIVSGIVTRVESSRYEDGAIRTDVSVAVEEVLRGDPTVRVLVLRQPGGRVGDEFFVDWGSADFERGERVLMFAEPGPDGVLRPVHGALGKLRIAAGADGIDRAIPGRAGLEAGLPIESWRERVWASDLAGRGRAPGPLVPAGSGSGPRPVAREEQSFRFFSPPYRWFEPDQGQIVYFKVDDDGDPTMSGLGFAETLAALGAWTGAAGSALWLSDSGAYPDPDYCLSPAAPFNHITFWDPCDEMSDLVNCGGVLGRGGVGGTCAEQRVVGGVSFCRVTFGRVVTNAHAGCTWSPALLAELLTHEVGHAIGLHHSSEDPAEADPRLAGATMYYRLHDDGRGAALGEDDLAGVNAMYLRQRFADVPVASVYAPYVEKVAASGITAGCGGGNYCPAAAVSREQMAVFLLRGLGVTAPPAPSRQTFLDVGPGNPYWPWIEELADRGITGGCGNGNYCPAAAVSRGQMAVFIVRAYGIFAPSPPPVPSFADVNLAHPFYAFIEALRSLGITGGCSASPPLYCPDAAVTREQMAVFLTRAFLY